MTLLYDQTLKDFALTFCKADFIPSLLSVRRV